jgi:hypothetical protein
MFNPDVSGWCSPPKCAYECRCSCLWGNIHGISSLINLVYQHHRILARHRPTYIFFLEMYPEIIRCGIFDGQTHEYASMVKSRWHGPKLTAEADEHTLASGRGAVFQENVSNWVATWTWVLKQHIKLTKTGGWWFYMIWPIKTWGYHRDFAHIYMGIRREVNTGGSQHWASVQRWLRWIPQLILFLFDSDRCV